MSTVLHSTQNSKEICLQYSKNDQESILQSLNNKTETVIVNQPTALAISKVSGTLNGDSIPELQNVEDGRSSAECSPAKTSSTPETSPFKQAVRGFVLNKLSKKVGTSHLLSGITEKLVKKLEDKDYSSNKEQIPATEKPQTIPQIKESSAELVLEPIPCELKSVVANDLLIEASSVEEAIECFEEAKSVDESGKMFLKPKMTSRSLPSSPAHTFIRRTSMDVIDNSSDSEEKSSVSESFNITSTPAKLLQNIETLPSSNANEIELVAISTDSLKRESNGVQTYKQLGTNEYPQNAYCGRNKTPEKIFEVNKHSSLIYRLHKILVSIPALHWLLLIAILIHKYNFFSYYYIEGIFDATIIFYISLSLFTKMQKSKHSAPLHTTYSHDKLDTATIYHGEANKGFKGIVRILKGNYDPDQQNNPPSELVNISIEEDCLKISSLLKDENDVCIPYEVYNLCGAKVSLLPKGLPKRRIFSKKYPISIILPPEDKKTQSASGVLEDLPPEDKCDFISLVAYEDGLLEMSNKRALYFFALTSREKESWYQALTNCLKTCDKNSVQQNASLSSSSRKFDASAMSFSSLLETNSDENLSITEDSCGTESDVNLTSSETKLSIEFAEYMEFIWENYQRIPNDLQNSVSPEASPESNKKTSYTLKNSTSVEWLNVALGRICYDFITQKRWCDEVMVRIQKKLDKIDLPNFVEPLTVTEVFMGTSVPQLHAVSSPSVDSFGIWFDFDFTYSGSFYMTLKTRLQIPKEKTLSSNEVSDTSSFRQSIDGSDASDEESSSNKRSPKHKLINRIEKWVTHKHFQTVAQSRFVKKYVGDISNMPLTLTVEVNLLQGILALNIPPAPTDRIWYGFRKDPTLSLTASPKVGSREINLSAVVQMIERKLKLAFKKAIVIPHMDDLIIPIMFTPVYDE